MTVMSGLRRILMSVGRGTTQIVLPSSCIVCEEELPLTGRKGSCCQRCWNALPRIDHATCVRCGYISALGRGETFCCLECVDDPAPFEGFYAWGSYRGGLEKAIQAFKYRNHDFLAGHFASLLAEVVPSRPWVVVPVPLHPSRRRQRGFNQAESLARSFARLRVVPLDTRLLRRVRPTASQSSLGREERRRNVRRAFEVVGEVRGLTILLVDDVATTGATLRECGRTLLSAGATEVHAAVIARA